MTYGDCEYGTLFGTYGNLCPPGLGPGPLPASTLGAKLQFADDEDAIAAVFTILI